MRTDRFKAFTLVEILTTLTIIAILIGILLPALGQVKKFATEAKQKAQIASLDIAVSSFKLDFGYYPPSHGSDATQTPGHSSADADFYDYDYCGAQTLAEAMVGWDLLGVHRDSVSRVDGNDNDTSTPPLYPSNPDAANLDKRKGPYLDRTNIGVFTPRQIFNRDTTSDDVYPDRYVICDAFAAVSKRVGAKTYKIGTPILYFRANLSAVNTQLITAANAKGWTRNIYNFWDNVNLMGIGRITDGKSHSLMPGDEGDAFCNFISDQMIQNIKRPVRPDSFLLISAGYDGLYGTADDICNFEPNIE